MQGNTKYIQQKQQFINAVVKLLPFEGWEDSLLSAANEECGFSYGYHNILFPGGLSEIVKYFEDWQDNKMIEYLATIPKPTKVREKIALAISTRIKNFVPKTSQIKTLSYFAIPANAALGFKSAWQTCDHIWHYAGDQSTDHNYYTKRTLLIATFIPALLFYFADDSENYHDTDKFIIESLNKVTYIGNLKKCFKLPELTNIPILRLFL